ncbi:MAG: Rieske 2Fe-2S domain-containing protein [Ramlibacter sp.]|nr:Rieske 2Fe-2S domain-containing protein [Ramlibacter sp.]
MSAPSCGDIRTDTAPGAAFYRSDAAWTLARERVFVPSWQWLGHLGEVAATQTLAPRTLLPGSLDEPLLLARDAQGTLRCLSNVCTHRANLLVAAPCSAPHIRCGYHGRRFGLDGTVQASPGFTAQDGFPAPTDHLPQPAFGTWAGQGFASLSPATPLADWLAPVEQRCGALPGLQALRPAPARDADHVVQAHWAVVVENYLDGLHIPFIHPGLNTAIDMGHYRYELFPGACLQLALAREGEVAFAPPTDGPDAGLRVAAYYWWLFPNLMLNIYPWGISVNVVLPESPERTTVQFRSLVWDEALLGQGAGGDLQRVQDEDAAVMQAVQLGLRARLWRPGRYAAQHESGIHHFHRLLKAALGEI